MRSVVLEGVFAFVAGDELHDQLGQLVLIGTIPAVVQLQQEPF